MNSFMKLAHKQKGGSKAPLGSGERFAALQNKLAHEPGVRNPAAVAASAGIKKYGASKMSQLSRMGRGRR